MPYIVAVRRLIKRGSLEKGTAPVIGFEAEPRYGEHVNPTDAKRAFIEEFDPRFKGAPDRLIDGEWHAVSGNMQMAKLVRKKKAV